MKRSKSKDWVVPDIGYLILRPILRLYVFITMHPKLINKDNIPKKGGVILAGTHTSKNDFMVVGSGTLRAVHFLTKKELMDIKGLKWLFRFAGLIRVDRSRSNPEAKKEAIDALNADKVVCVFPEGTINKTDDPIMKFKAGAVYFAIQTGKPIVPFAITGKPKAFKYGSKIIYGKPYYVKTDDVEKEVKVLEDKVVELIKEISSNEK